MSVATFLYRRANSLQVRLCCQIRVEYNYENFSKKKENANLKFVSFNVLELQKSAKEGRMVLREDRKRHANCTDEDLNDGKRCKPEGQEIINEDNGRIMEDMTKHLEKPPDFTQMKENNNGELYLISFCYKVLINAVSLKNFDSSL